MIENQWLYDLEQIPENENHWLCDLKYTIPEEWKLLTAWPVINKF